MGIATAEYLMICLFFFFSSYPKAQIKERWKFKNVRFKTWSVHVLPPISAEGQNYIEEIVKGCSNKKARRSSDSTASKTPAGVDTKLHDSTRKVYG
jgi:hypothetical protein